LSIEKVYQCKEIQLSLLEDAYEMLKGKGRLLYSTCSFSIQENEEVIIEFLNKHLDMEIIPIELNKIYDDTLTIKGGLRLYPFKFNGEGQTIFILQKKPKRMNWKWILNLQFMK
jgi:16S rRNA C967 or C1407 C5-methylase (RsmB/RsmF family)